MTTVDSPRRTKAWKVLLVLMALALLPRLALILAPSVDLYGKAKPGEPNISIGEEIARGNIAQEILRGPLVPLIDYQYAPFFGGSLVAGILTVPSFVAFGPTLFALKLVPIGFHLLALFFLFRILDRFVSRRAAWIGGAMFALSPPGYTLITTISWGSHMESNALAMAAVWMFLDLTDHPDPKHRKRFAFGLLAGFSVYFGYQCAVFLAVLTLFDLFRDRTFFLRRTFLSQVLGFVIGFIPWIIYNVRNDFSGLAIYGRSFGEHMAGEAEGFMARAFSLFTHGLPGSLFFPRDWVLPAALTNLVIAVALGTLAVVGAVGARPTIVAGFRRLFRPSGSNAVPPPVAIAVVYLAVFLGVFLQSDFKIGKVSDDLRTYRYAMLLFPWLVIAAASVLDGLLVVDDGRKWLWRGVPIGIAATCLIGLVGYMDFGRFGDDWEEPGYSDSGLGGTLLMTFKDDPKVYERITENALEDRTHEERDQLFRGIGRLLFSLGKERKRMSDEERAEAKHWSSVQGYFRAFVPAPYTRYFKKRDKWVDFLD